MSKSTSSSDSGSEKAPAAKSGLKKLNLSGFNKAKPEAKEKAYPELPDPTGEIAELVDDMLEKMEQVEALSGAVEVEKSELVTMAKKFYFDSLHGKTTIPSSVVVKGKTREAMVSFANRYRGTADEEALTRLAGDKAGDFFTQSFEIRINGDKLPPDSADELIAELQELFAKYNAVDALTANATFRPNKEFHTARHTAFEPEMNLELDKIVPVVAMVKARSSKDS